MEPDVLEGGFCNAPIDAAYAFRAAMNAMARPGQIETVAGAQPPGPLSVSAGVVILTLCDPETPIYLAGDHNCTQVRDWITFHTGAPMTGPADAIFALGKWSDLVPLDQYRIGTPRYPDRSATVIVEMDELSNAGETLSGPGIETATNLSLPDRQRFQQNATLYPLGLDFFLTAGDRLAALPRTTKIAGVS
ncbi:phosphonate C-P lyase system protein PhnH [Litoreibacter roseus]|uniref:Carbon-phosphorus lyase subunit PhnH n=1 Tax=Litoreibacter roseus TaxID=2601869 RepID=A0A6N6JLH2_9RHOB|nr:phosphonate C-P lyase system protein PhnH [Litoreibacter roseus]GFE66128.1 carbon-phosphorus lyase subunit PhnH [Litoreibacter roseus]